MADQDFLFVIDTDPQGPYISTGGIEDKLKPVLSSFFMPSQSISLYYRGDPPPQRLPCPWKIQERFLLQKVYRADTEGEPRVW